MPGPHGYIHSATDETVKSGPGTLHEIILAAGVDVATVIAYDNTTASGSIICQLAAVIGGTARFSPKGGVSFSKGITLAYTGTSPTASLAID